MLALVLDFFTTKAAEDDLLAIQRLHVFLRLLALDG